MVPATLPETDCAAAEGTTASARRAADSALRSRTSIGPPASFRCFPENCTAKVKVYPLGGERLQLVRPHWQLLRTRGGFVAKSNEFTTIGQSNYDVRPRAA